MILTPYFPSLFNFKQDTKDYIIDFAMAFSIAIPLKYVGAMLSGGILKAGGDTKFTLLVETLGLWVFGTGLLALSVFVFHLPPFWAYLIAQTESLNKAVMCLARFKSKKWIRNLTKT